VLVGLDRFFKTKIAPTVLGAIGLELGADVPMCLCGAALRARGIGEQIERLEGWPALPLVLVWPGRPVATAEVFRTLPGRENPPLPAPPSAVTVPDIAGWLGGCRNDLERPALTLAVEIGEALRLLRGPDCLLARMSGSGSACFGLYADFAAAEAAALALRKARPGWWIEAALAH
jgi:4-diphosphocytidyl-2-C-methyl-D-erythritol kinase